MIWWVVAFTCVFETLHSVSSRAIGWLLHLLGSLLHCLGHYSQQIARIARAFPCTLHQRSKYLEKKKSLSSVHQYVVCHDCLSLYEYEACIERKGSSSSVKMCPQCESTRKNVPLLKEVISSSGTKKHYPFLVYPYMSLVSSLHCLFARPKFYTLCEQWREQLNPEKAHTHLSDVYDGERTVLSGSGAPVLGPD